LDPHRSLQIAVPRIIRLLGYDKLPAAGGEVQPPNIYARDGNRCQYAARRCDHGAVLGPRHLPRARAGKAMGNIVCCCVRCNVKKGGRTPEQAHMH